MRIEPPPGPVELFFPDVPHPPFAAVQVLYRDREGIEEAFASHASAPSSYEVQAPSGRITVSLRDAEGEPLGAVYAGGYQYVLGEEGQHYRIVIANRAPERYEVVTLVDGVDVVGGRTDGAAFRGQVLSPWSDLEMDGGRRVGDELAPFRFGSVRNSASARLEGDRGVGSITIGFFAQGDAPHSDR